MVGVCVGVKVAVGATNCGTDTAPMAQSLLVPRAQDVVTEAAPAFVLPPPKISFAPAVVKRFQRWVCPIAGVMLVASPRTAAVSRTIDPAELASVTVAGDELTLPALLLAKPSDAVLCTAPVSEADPATQRLEAFRLTVTVFVPEFGFARAQISTRTTGPTPSDRPPTRERAWAPYVTDATVVVRVETPTRSIRLAPAETVWLQESVATLAAPEVVFAVASKATCAARGDATSAPKTNTIRRRTGRICPAAQWPRFRRIFHYAPISFCCCRPRKLWKQFSS